MDNWSWVFEITDWTTGVAVTTTVNSPQGWEEVVFNMKRDPKYHGIFFDYSCDSLKFTDDAADILEVAYLAKGIESETYLTITYNCDSQQVLFTGQFNYHKYKKTCAEKQGCWVEIPVESSGSLMKLMSRIDQKVNLDATEDFGGNALTPYAGLSKVITLESKAIYKQDEYWIENLTIGEPKIDWSQPIIGGGLGTAFTQYFTMPFGDSLNGKIKLQEFHDNPYDNSSKPIYTMQAMDIYAVPTDVPWSQIIVGESLTYNFAIDMIVKVDVDAGGSLITDASVNIMQRKNGTITTLVSFPSTGIPAANHFVWSAAVTHTWTASFLDGDDVTYFLQVFVQTNITSGTPTLPCTLTLLETVALDYAYFKYNALSTLPSSPCVSYLINESLARTVECITDGEMTAYGDYFGRTDAEPYPSVADGCGGLEMITNGLKIREALITGVFYPQMTISLKDLLKNLNAIHCIGMGIEADPNRPGFDLVRVESFDYFYDPSVVMFCPAVNVLEVECNYEGFISTYKFGYNKYESEEYNGIDEFLTSREYRSTLKTVKNELDTTCDFIASGYAIEVTRIKAVETSDWRFDNDTFIICLKRDGVNLVVEQGNITNDANIIDPPTVYNFRISPIRNAFRWLKILMANYTDISGSNSYYEITYSKGNANAQGTLTDGCTIERLDIDTSENTVLAVANIENIEDATPLWTNELVKFEYPLTVYEYNVLKASPYGKIGFNFFGKQFQYGWIKELKYRAAEGMADFVLIMSR